MQIYRFILAYARLKAEKSENTGICRLASQQKREACQECDDEDSYQENDETAVEKHGDGALEGATPRQSVELEIVYPIYHKGAENGELVDVIDRCTTMQKDQYDTDEEHLAGNVGLNKELLSKVVVGQVASMAKS